MFLSLILVFLLSCYSNEKRYKGINDFPDVYVCEDSACGSYPELMLCNDGNYPKQIQCEFIESYGCEWMPICDNLDGGQDAKE